MTAVLSVWRRPFGHKPVVRRLAEGMTLAAMAAEMPGLPHDFSARGVICVNGHPVQRSAWARLRPHAATPAGVPVEVTFHCPPMGGGGRRGGKRLLGLIASIALIGLTAGISGGAAAKFLGARFAAGTFGARALAFGVNLVGNLAIAALTAPPVARGQEAGQNPGTASVDGNVLAPDAAIPRVIGERKIFPPFVVPPLTYFSGADEVVEAVYGLAGPHRMRDVRVGGVDAAAVTVEVELREGWPGDAPLLLVTRQSFTETVNAEVRRHVTLGDNGRDIEIGVDGLAASLPQPQVVTTRAAPDVHWLHLVFPTGLNQSAATQALRVPLRLRMRPRGSATWRNLPEIHINDATMQQSRLTIAFEWTSATVAPATGFSQGFVEARRFVPAQTATPGTTGGWTADPYFGTGGDAWMDGLNLGTTGVQNVSMDRYTARIRLDPAQWPPGRWEIEVLRGAAFRNSDYVAATYQTAASVWDHFGYRNTPSEIQLATQEVTDQLYLVRSVSVWNEAPVASGGLALVAVRARNRALGPVSVQAGGYVRDWDGAGWNTWTVTDNPAPHLREIMLDAYQSHRSPVALMDDDALVDWRADCTRLGFACNAVLESTTASEAAQIVAGCGYARPQWVPPCGPIRDRDRSLDAPVQVFTQRNSRGVSWGRSLGEVPDALLVSFRDGADDGQLTQVVVPAPGVEVPQLTEAVTLEGLATEGEVFDRARFDLRQAQLRDTTWSFEAPAEALVCRRGSLIGLTHDSLTRFQGAGRVIDRRFTGGGLVDRVLLDSDVRLAGGPSAFEITDAFAVTDTFAVGVESAAIVRGPSGVGPGLALTDAAGVTNVLTFAVPQTAADVPEGALVSVGELGQTHERLIVVDMAPRGQDVWVINAVAEANELHPPTAHFGGVMLTFRGRRVEFGGTNAVS